MDNILKANISRSYDERLEINDLIEVLSKADAKLIKNPLFNGFSLSITNLYRRFYN